MLEAVAFSLLGRAPASRAGIPLGVMVRTRRGYLHRTPLHSADGERPKTYCESKSRLFEGKEMEFPFNGQLSRLILI